MRSPNILWGRFWENRFPEEEEELDALKRVEEATRHISKASDIIRNLQADLKRKVGCTKSVDIAN